MADWKTCGYNPSYDVTFPEIHEMRMLSGSHGTKPKTCVTVHHQLFGPYLKPLELP